MLELRGAVVAAVVGACLVARPALAHEVGLSRGEYVLEGSTLDARVTFARKELIGLVAGLDANHDGILTDEEVTASRDAIQGAIVGRVKVSGDGAPCAGSIGKVGLVDQDGVSVGATYRCARRPKKLTIALGFFDDLPFGHRHLARATAGAASVDQVLSQRSPDVSLDVPPGPDSAPPPAVEAKTSGSPFVAGVQRGFASWRATAFIVAVLVAATERREIVAAAVSTTLAIAVGVLLAATGYLAVSPHAIAVASGAALFYAGVEALGTRLGQTSIKAWRSAVPLAVVLGLGSATSLSRATLAASLAGLVVAIGLLATCVAVILLQASRRAPAARWFAVIGAAVAITGLADLILAARA